MNSVTYSAGKILCAVRNYPISNSPEERVRQKLLKQLLSYDRSLLNFILLEVLTEAGRADIVIYDHTHTPFLTIELKSPSCVINETTLEQVMRYWQTLQSPFVAVSNGRHTKIYHAEDGEPKEIQENDIVRFLEEQNIEYPSYLPLQRMEIELTTYERYLNYLTEVGYISDQTPAPRQALFSELQNALLTEKYIPSGRDLPIVIENDFGTSYLAYKNAGNGTWDGMHRNFRVRVKYKGVFTFRIAILASASFQNDPVFGNRTGATFLNISMQKHNSSTYNLQLNLDKFILETDETYTIWHSGVRSRTKKQQILSEVETYAGFLLEDGVVKLGKLPKKRSIAAEEFSSFVENLIVYSAVRDRVK